MGDPFHIGGLLNGCAVLRWMEGESTGASRGRLPAAEDPAQIQHHEADQCPYLEVQLDGSLIHAQEIASYGPRVMVRYPAQVLDTNHFSHLKVAWVDREKTRRIRRENACWNNPVDSIDWHELEDESLQDEVPGYRSAKQQNPERRVLDHQPPTADRLSGGPLEGA